ncbi:hypothetical protein Q9L58_003630 [Maublancomyces gigas]|uniref:Nitrogen regulatory protein areA GATA-like domain-containing protein n=1 Tax=Discina gigas TaxID=1032678 RepID=A0ABR3GND0_9PEZI
MKPIGGIVTSKKSIPENFRQVENFTTEYLSKLWKIYTINRDVLDKGRRLENLFWRIWGSERTDRMFSGAKVSKIFMMIVEGEGQFEQTKYRIPPRQISPRQIPPRQITAPPPYPIETLTTPRPSLEIECPPTPPPSPIPPVKSVVGFQLGSSKFSSQRAITDFLQQAFPDAPPSPPIPYALSSATPTIPEGVEVSSAESPKLPLPTVLEITIAAAAAAKDQLSYSTVASEEGDSASEKDDRKKEKARKAKPERPARGRRKVVAVTKATTARTTAATTARTTAATTTRTTAAAAGRTTAATTARTTAARKARPGVPRRKSSSSSNTAVNTAVSSPSNTLTVDVARSLPSASQKQRRGNQSARDGSESEGKKGDKSDGWVVDPDFRTKYLERKKRENLVALTFIVPVTVTKTMSTTTIVESVAAVPTKAGRGKGKNGLVVDEIVPLKGLVEDVRGVQASKVIESVLEKEIDELPSNLVRRKSELTLLFEGAKKAGEKSAKGRSTKKVQVIVEGEIRR